MCGKLDKEDIEKAIELYEELGDYKDSKEKLAEAEKEKEKQNALKKLEYAYNDCLNKGTVLSSDKKSIIVNSADQYDSAAMLDVITIINKLNLPDSLLEEMMYTNALMGRQTETFGYYQVNWSYHPDNGLDVIFNFIG